MSTLLPFLFLAAGYLIGSLSFAVLVSRAMRLDDPRSYGSGNPGATNVLRSGNKTAAVLTLVLDAAKGMAAVLLARWVVSSPSLAGMSHANGGAADWAVALAGLGAFIGHVWPVFFRFRGGKGVATAAGVLLALNPWLGLATIVTWILIVVFFRYSSLAALVSAAFAPFYQLLIWGGGVDAVAIGLMSLLLLWRHAPNIGRLMAGKETKLGRKAKA